MSVTTMIVSSAISYQKIFFFHSVITHVTASTNLLSGALNPVFFVFAHATHLDDPKIFFNIQITRRVSNLANNVDLQIKKEVLMLKDKKDQDKSGGEIRPQIYSEGKHKHFFN